MAKHSALIIEDDATSQKIMSSLLTDMGFTVETANNGATGIYHYLCDGDYTVILLDIMMPEIDGATFLQLLESMINSGKIRCRNNVIVQTAVANYEYLQRLLSYKAVFSVRTKPCRRVDIEKDIKGIIDNLTASKPLIRKASRCSRRRR